MIWKWTARDGNPPDVFAGYHLVALEIGRVRVLYWSGHEWCEQMNFAPYEIEVLAWSPFPDMPAIPKDVKKIRGLK